MPKNPFPRTVKDGLSRSRALWLERNSAPGLPADKRNLHPPPLDENKFNIVVGDRVCILEGQDKGKMGIVRNIFWQKRWVYVSGRNSNFLQAERSKSTYYHEERPLDWAQVALVDTKDNLPCTAKIVYLEDGTKARVSDRTGSVILFPPELVEPPQLAGYKDTSPDVASERTYVVSSGSFADSILKAANFEFALPAELVPEEGADPVLSALTFQKLRAAAGPPPEPATAS